MKLVLLLLTISSSALLFTSCKKGDDGEPGTANVKYSEWFTPAPYKKDTIFGIWGFNYIQDAPAITEDILQKGTVLTFGKLLGYNGLIWPANQVGQLPINLTYNQAGVTTDTWSAGLSPGKIKIRFVNDRNTYTTIATQHQFRYIVIPGGVTAGRGQVMSYEEVCKTYNIPE